MTKKDYQAIAGALYSAKEQEAESEAAVLGIEHARDLIADVLAADNPRFDRECFVAACEDGNVRRTPGRLRRDRERGVPLCVQAMGCYCAGHARGNPASEPCDTREA